MPESAIVYTRKCHSLHPFLPSLMEGLGVAPSPYGGAGGGTISKDFRIKG